MLPDDIKTSGLGANFQIVLKFSSGWERENQNAYLQVNVGINGVVKTASPLVASLAISRAIVQTRDLRKV